TTHLSTIEPCDNKGGALPGYRGGLLAALSAYDQTIAGSYGCQRSGPRRSLAVNLLIRSFSTGWRSIPCVSTVSIVCAIRAPVPVRPEDDLPPPHIHCRCAADGADCADGAVGSGLADGRYPDCSHSQPPLAAEDNLNAKCAEEGLGPAQSAGKGAWALWP